MKLNNLKRSLLPTLLAALLSCAAVPAFAQPDPNNQPMGANPLPGMPFGNAGAWQKMTPAERGAAMRKMIEPMLRTMLNGMGAADKELQDAVIASALEQEAILDEVRAKHRAVAQALMGNVATEAQLQALMADLRSSVESAKTRRLASVATLEERTNFSQMPKLAAFLSLSGVTGDESAFIGGILGNFTSAMMNLGIEPPPAPAPAEQPE